MRILQFSLLTLLCCLLTVDIFADQKGSDTVVSVEPYFTFPATPVLSNLIYTFAYFKDGFGLQDSTTTCTVKSIFPISGDINLHGGQLYLVSDFIIHDSATFVTSGAIEGDGHSFDIAQSVTGIPAAYTTYFHDTNVFLRGDFLISGTVKFRGQCLLEGSFNRVTLGNNANIIVDHNSSLRLRNIEIEGINNYNIRCLNDGGTIILDNMSWVQDADYTFTTGSLEFVNDVSVVGPWKFNYTTAMASTIQAESTLQFDWGTTFSYAPRTATPNLLLMTDATSKLYLNGCTLHSTRTGLQLSSGTIFVDNKVTLSSEARYDAEALRLQSNLNITLLSAAKLALFGRVKYE